MVPNETKQEPNGDAATDRESYVILPFMGRSDLGLYRPMNRGVREIQHLEENERAAR